MSEDEQLSDSIGAIYDAALDLLTPDLRVQKRSRVDLETSLG